MHKIFLITLLFISSIGFAQDNDEANLPKGKLYNNPVVDVAKIYTTKAVIAEKNSEKWKKQGNYLFSTGKCKPNTTYKHQSASFKLPELSSKNERINLHISESYELESYYDEGKVLVSEDNGATWQLVSVRSGKSELRTSVINLTKYAGKKVLITFELKTDDSYNYDGWTIEGAFLKIEEVAMGSKSTGTPMCKSASQLQSGSTSNLSGSFTNLDSYNFPSQVTLSCEINENGQAIAVLDSTHFTVYERIDSLWTYDSTWTQGVQYVDYRNVVNTPLEFIVKTPDSTATDKYVDIVFLMDNSGSMGDEQSAVKSNVGKFLDSLQVKGIKAQIGLIRFGQSANSGRPLVVSNAVGSWWTNYGTSSTYDIDAFKTMWSSTNTIDGGFEPSYDALMKGIDGVSYTFAPSAKKIFILITDESMTNNNASGSNYTDSTAVINALNAKDVTVYSLSLNQEPHLSDFGSIADGTGGEFYNILSPFDDILDDIVAQVSNKYEILFPPTRPIYDGLKRKVEIEVAYNGDTLLLTGQDYTPGAAPKIELTQHTLDTLHSPIPFLKDSTAPVQVYIYDYDAPRPHDGGTNRYVKLYYKNVNDTTTNYYELNMTLDSVLGIGDTTVWSANIPGNHVQPPGIEYYITASDSLTTTPSPILPVQYTWTFSVTPNYPPQLTDSTTYVDAATAGLMEKMGYNIGDSVTFRVLAEDTTFLIKDVYLYFSIPSNPQFSPMKMDSIGNGIYSKTITLGGGDTRYFFMGTDNYGVSSWLATEFNPFVIKTQMTDPSYRHDISIGGLVFSPSQPPMPWNATIEWVNDTLTTGDSIKIYTSDMIGDKCIATKAHDEESFRVSGDDPNVAGKDGFYLNDEFLFKIYKASTGKIYDAEVVYQPGSDTLFKDNGVSNVESIIVYGHRSILSYEDNWWSTYANLDDKSFDAIFADVVNDIDMVKDHLGNTWAPGLSTNTLTTYVNGYGYEVNLKSNKNPLEVIHVGKQRNCSNETPTIEVDPNFTYVGCPYVNPESLANIASANSGIDIITKLVEDGNYEHYYAKYPSYSSWQTDQYMYPGKAYKIVSYNSTSFNLSFPTQTLKSATTAREYPDAVTYPQKPRSSEEFMHLLLPEKAWTNTPLIGDIVKAYNKSGDLIGQNYVFNNGTSMLIDGLDLANGEAFEIRYESAKTGAQTGIVISNWEVGDATYEPNKMAIAGSVHTQSSINKEMLVRDLTIYPNPASDKISAVIELINDATITVKLTDVTGSTVFSSADVQYPKGSSNINIPTKFGRGMYTLTVIDQNGHKLSKQVIVK